MRDKFSQMKLMKKWMLILGIFFAAQVVFIAIDGTFLEPKLNNLGDFASNIAGHIFLKEWFTIYENPIHKLITILAILQIAYLAIKDIVNFARPRRNL